MDAVGLLNHCISDLVRKFIVSLALKLCISQKWSAVFLNECLLKYRSVIQRLAFRDFRILTEKLNVMLILHLEMLRVSDSVTVFWYVKLLCLAAVV